MTSGAHTIDENANLKAQIDSEGPGLSFGYFEILLACIVIEIIASFWENSLLFGKFDLFWPPVTSILTSSKNDPYVFCSTLHGLSNAIYRFSMRCVVLEISGGGGWNQPPPPVLGWLRPPPVRGLSLSGGEGVYPSTREVCINGFSFTKIRKSAIL